MDIQVGQLYKSVDRRFPALRRVVAVGEGRVMLEAEGGKRQTKIRTVRFSKAYKFVSEGQTEAPGKGGQVDGGGGSAIDNNKIESLAVTQTAELENDGDDAALVELSGEDEYVDAEEYEQDDEVQELEF